MDFGGVLKNLERIRAEIDLFAANDGDPVTGESFERVRQRQIRQVAFLAHGVWQARVAGGAHPQDLPMRVHHALRRPGCAGGVNQGDEVIRGDLLQRGLEPARRRGPFGAATQEKLLPANSSAGLTLDEHDVAQGGQSIADSLKLLQHARVLDERYLRLAVPDDVRQLLGRERVVQTDRHRARVQQAQVGNQVFGTVARQNDAKATWRQAERLQTVSDESDEVAILAPRS